MSHFGAYLGQVIAADFDGHRANFAREAGVVPPSITNYITKDEMPSFVTLGRVVNAVRDPVKRAQLVDAYWMDIQAAAEIKGVDVEIRPSDRGITADEVEQKITKILAVLRSRARRDPKFLRIIQDIADWLA
jgi:hypothetical protein